jgi:hypothetical protein
MLINPSQSIAYKLCRKMLSAKAIKVSQIPFFKLETLFRRYEKTNAKKENKQIMKIASAA